MATLSSLGGSDYILRGCEIQGDNVAPGWMVLDNEIFRFEGGPLAVDVTISETIEDVTYLEDLAPQDGLGDQKPGYFHRSAIFGDTGTYTIPFASLERVRPITDIQKQLVPIGAILDWSGAIADIPQGWSLCDGANGTPDLRGRFIVSYDSREADYDAVGKQGGAKEVPLTVDQMPAHNHTGTATAAGAHTVTTRIREDAFGTGDGASLARNTSGNDEGFRDFNSNPVPNHTHSVTTNNAGGGQPHENRPPYYVLAKIMFTG
ncbi:phage baseplate protein [Spongiimicrobium salis]|uniref:phage baseplate protein n=1 Tax=Spongiimicrobium salis TaxID=1667022 RepID=UPI00374D6380